MKTRYFLPLIMLLALLSAGCLGNKKASPSSPAGTAPVRTAQTTSTEMQTRTPSPTATLPVPATVQVAATATPVVTTEVSTTDQTTSTPAQPETTAVASEPPTTNPGSPGANLITATPTSGPAPEAAACTDKAAFVGDVTVPDDTVFRQGETFVKTWRLYNAGECTWDERYAMIFAGGDNLSSAASISLPKTLPNQVMDVSLDMTAPQQGGQYVSRYLIQSPDGRRFGINGQGMIYSQILVNYVSPTGVPGNTDNPNANPSPGIPAQDPAPNSSNPVPAAVGCNYQRNNDYENQMLALINNVRAQNSLPALNINPQLGQAAFNYSLDMACNNRVDFIHHTDSNGKRPVDRIADSGYKAFITRENVAAGYGVQETFDYWMVDPDDPVHRWHRMAMLNLDVTDIGIAYVHTSTSDFGGYFTVDFAMPK